MTREEVFVILTDVFRDVLDDDSITLRNETTADDVEGWDSLSHIRLIVAVEKRFNLRFPTSKVVSLRNVGEMADLIMSKL